jgi:hypothetical protein
MARDYNHKDVFSHRKNGGSPVFWIIAAIIFSLGALAIVLLYLILYSPLPKVKKVSSSGLSIVSPENLTSALSIHLVGSSRIRAILGPDNIISWEFLGKYSLPPLLLPTVKETVINSNIFEKVVRVEAKERELFGIWCLFPNKQDAPLVTSSVFFGAPISLDRGDDQECFAFDETGVIFQEVPIPYGSLILKIIDENYRPIIFGKTLIKDSELSNLLNTVNIVKSYGLGIAQIEIKDKALAEWETKMVAGPTLLFSLRFVPEELEAILENLRERLDFEKLNYLDFRVPNRIYYK